MRHARRRDEVRRSRGKLDDKLGLPEDEMAADGMVKIPKRCDSAPAKREIQHIPVFVCADPRTKVHGGGCKDTFIKIALLSRMIVDRLHGVPIIPVKQRGPQLKSACNAISESAMRIKKHTHYPGKRQSVGSPDGLVYVESIRRAFPLRASFLPTFHSLEIFRN